MAARGIDSGSISSRVLVPSFHDFLLEIVPMFTEENLTAMKRFMKDVISLKIGVECEAARDLLGELWKSHCISEHDLDLLEDLLGVSGRRDILDMLRDYKKKCPSNLESMSTEPIGELIPGN